MLICLLQQQIYLFNSLFRVYHHRYQHVRFIKLMLQHDLHQTFIYVTISLAILVLHEDEQFLQFPLLTPLILPLIISFFYSLLLNVSFDSNPYVLFQIYSFLLLFLKLLHFHQDSRHYYDSFFHLLPFLLLYQIHQSSSHLQHYYHLMSSLQDLLHLFQHYH